MVSKNRYIIPIVSIQFLAKKPKLASRPEKPHLTLQDNSNMNAWYKGWFPVNGIFRATGILHNKRLITCKFLFKFKAMFSLVKNRFQSAQKIPPHRQEIILKTLFFTKNFETGLTNEKPM